MPAAASPIRHPIKKAVSNAAKGSDDTGAIAHSANMGVGPALAKRCFSHTQPGTGTLLYHLPLVKAGA